MLTRCRRLILGGALGFSTFVLESVGASAATLLPPPESAFAGGTVFEVTVIEVKKKPDPATIWNRVHDGDRCHYRIGPCRHFYRGYYYETPWWGLPLATGGEVGENDVRHPKEVVAAS
jgi:hypothetical protein